MKPAASGNLLVDYEEAKIFGRCMGAAFRDPLVMRSLIDAGVTSAEVTALHLGKVWTISREQYRHLGRVDSSLVEDELAELIGDARVATETIEFCLKQPEIRMREELPGLLDHMRRRVAARKLASLCGSIARAALEPYANASALAEELRKQTEVIASGASSIRSAGGPELAAIGLRRLSSKEPVFERVSLGLPVIDDALGGGAVRGRVTVIGAGTGVGKSTYALHFVLSALSLGYRVLWFSFDSDRDELSSMLGETKAGIRHPTGGNEPTREQAMRLAEAYAWISEAPLWIEDEDGITVEQLMAIARSHMQLYGVNVVVVDYAQDVEKSPANFGREDLNYAHISKGLKRFAKDENVCVVELSQVTEKETGQRLNAEDTAFSKQFAKDAVAVLMVERNQSSKDVRLRDVSRVSLRKNRLTGRLVEEWMRYERATNRLIPCTEHGEPITIINAGYGTDDDDPFDA